MDNKSLIQEKASGVQWVRLDQYSSLFAFQPFYSLNPKAFLIIHKMGLQHLSDTLSLDKLRERARPSLNKGVESSVIQRALIHGEDQCFV